MILPLLAIASPSTLPSCPTAQIVATARLHRVNHAPWPNYPQGPIPDAAMMAQRRKAAFAVLKIKPLTDGLEAQGSTTVDWPGARCALSFMGHGTGGRLADGRVVRLDPGDTLSVVRVDTSAEEEPLPPEDRHARAVTSTRIWVGDWRVGVWRRADGRWLLSAYRSGSPAPSVPVMELAAPVIGLSYLGAPDSFGGRFTILQRMGHNSYRWSFIDWSEKAIIPPPKTP